LDLNRRGSTLENGLAKLVGKDVSRGKHRCHLEIPKISSEQGKYEIEEGYEIGQYAEVGIDVRFLRRWARAHLFVGERAKCAVFCWWHIIICMLKAALEL
jgi:hypothetical protein